MTDTPVSGLLAPFFISSWGQATGGAELHRRGGLANPAAITWVANQAVYIPFTIDYAYPVARVFWSNGSTITTSNACFAIYTLDGTQIYTTGSTALSGTSAPQYVDPTDFVLSPGRYYMAYNCDNTTSRVRGTTAATAAMQRQCGILQQAVGAIALPATMASAGAATQAIYPLCGITRTSSGF